MNNIYASIFGESPATMQAREARKSAFQDMLNARKQAAEQNRTDNTKMARYNAFGNLLTSLVQPLGWAAGGKGVGYAGGVQKYDDRQYIDAFNRAVKASDDLRNIGSAEAEYRFKLAEEDYRRQQSLDDAKRQQARMLERQEQAARAREERDQKLHEQKKELEEMKAAARQQLSEWKATHKVQTRGTGLSVDDRVMLKNLDAYNRYANTEAEYNRTPLSFADWLAQRGYDVQSVGAATGSPSTTRSTGTATQTAPANTQTQTQTQTQVQTTGVQPQGWGVMRNDRFMYNPSTAVSSGQPASAGGGPVFKFNPS